MVKPTKLRREIEPAWVSWYCLKYFPTYVIRYRVPLGSIPENIKEEYGNSRGARIYRPYRYEVDAIVIHPDKLIMVEAKIFKQMDGLSKLPVYKSLVPKTPELEKYWKFPVEMRLLVPVPLYRVIEAADLAGIKVIAEAPPEIMAVWEQRDKYWLPEAIREREERKKAMRRLGYD